MSESFDDGGLTAEELKSHLYQSLHSSGLLKKLKGELRQSMINELRGKSDQKKNKKDLLGPTIHKKTHSWLHQAIDNLVYLHLKQNRYQYSLSLFQQESSVESYSPSLTEDLLQRLGIESRDLDISIETPSSSISENVHLDASLSQRQDQRTLTIWKIFDKLSSLAATKTSTPRGKVKFASFNDEEKSLSLGEKLRAIDEEMNSKSSHVQRDPAIAISSYTAAVRRAEEDAERRAKAAFEQWKSVDLLQMKMEEAKKAKDLVYTRMKQLEEDYQRKLNALQERERAAVTRLTNQKEMHEKEMHEQRQNLLREIEQLRMREETLHKQETIIHETELIKRNELKMVRDQIASSRPRDTDVKKSPRPKEACADASEIESLQRQLNEKAAEFESTKRELTSLKADMSTVTCQQTRRENLLLRSQLEQLLRGARDYKSVVNENPATHGPRESLQEEIKRLKKENEEKDIEHRSLALTLKEVQQALEDSNAVFARLSSQEPRVKFADPEPEPSYVRKIMSSYSPSPKRDKLREYEPVQTGLHSSIVNSGEFDDPSMDESVASAGIRLDLQQRLKDLEKQTMEVDEQYQRYLNTNYRELMQAQSLARTDHGSPLTKPFGASSSLRNSPKKNFRNDHVTRPSQKGQKLEFFGLEDPVEVLHKTSERNRLNLDGLLLSDPPSKTDLRHEEPIKDLSSSYGSENFPEKLQAALKTEEEQPLPSQTKNNLFSEKDASLRNEVIPGSSPAQVTTTTPIQKPELKPESEPTSKDQEPRLLPPLVAPRKLPSLSRPDAPSAKISLASSTSVNEFQPTENRSFETHPGPSNIRDDSQSSDDRDSKSDLLSTKNQFNFTTEIALPSRSQNLPVNQVEVATSGDKSDVTRSPEFSLSSHSGGQVQAEANTKKETSSTSDHASLSKSKRRDSPSIDQRRKQGGFTTEESSISERIVKPTAKKNLDDFDPSNDDDISAALRWGDENQRSLVESNEAILPAEKPETEEEEVLEEKEVFEMSDRDLSLDSLASKKNSVEDNHSDVSW